MWKHVLVLMLILCAPPVRAQSQPVSTEPTPLQKKAVVLGAELQLHPVAIVRTYVDPREQFERMQIADAFRQRQLALRHDTVWPPN